MSPLYPSFIIHLHKAPIPQNGDLERPLKDRKLARSFHQCPRCSKICCLCGMLRKPLKDHWKTKNNFSSKIPVGSWWQLKVYWETNNTIERSLSSGMTAKDLWKINQDLWKTDRDHWKNSERLTRPPRELWKTDRDCCKDSERTI